MQKSSLRISIIISAICLTVFSFACGPADIGSSNCDPAGLGCSDCGPVDIGFSDAYRFDKMVNMGTGINTSYNELGPSVTTDGNTMYFTSNRPGGYGDYDVYVATRVDGVWQAPLNLGQVVNDSTRQFDVAVIPDGTRIFFSSSEGLPGLGYSRIWVSEIVDGVAQPATMLPSSVNLSGSNNSPRFVSTDGQWLYFSAFLSTAWDVLRVDLNSGAYSNVEHLPAPINSNGRDYGLYLTSDGKYLMYTSDKDSSYVFKGYVSEIINGVYQTEQLLPVPFNFEAKGMRHCNFTENEAIAYFDSEPVAGGYGGHDLYYAVRFGFHW